MKEELNKIPFGDWFSFLSRAQDLEDLAERLVFGGKLSSLN